MAHRIDGEGAVASAPTPQAVGSTVGYFAAEGTLPATQVTGDWLNSVQEEIAAVATMKGAALSKADNGQAKTALEGVLGIESRGTEAAGITTSRRHVVIASFDATVGESAGGVVNTLVAASSESLAKGFQSAVIASESCRAGDVGGNDIDCAVIASQNVNIDASIAAALASSAATVSGPNSAMVAVTGDDVGEVSGSSSVAIAAFSPTVSGNYSAVLAANLAATVSGEGSAVIGGNGHDVSGNEATTHGGYDNIIAGDNSHTIGGADHEIDVGAVIVVGGSGIFAPNPGANSSVVVLASRNVDLSVGTDFGAGGGGIKPPSNSVALGYEGNDANPKVGPSILLEANGGNIRYTGTLDGPGADYAEMFANAERGEIPPLRLVTLDVEGVRVAGAGARILGAARPARAGGIVGNSDALGWHGRFVRDEAGAYVLEAVEEIERVPDRAAIAARRIASEEARATLRDAKRRLALAEDDERATAEADVQRARDALDALGALPKPLRVEKRRQVLQPKRSPAFDPSRQHVPRAMRPHEHTCVALLGQVRVAVDASVRPGDDVIAAEGGIGTLGSWVGRGAQLECMRILVPFDATKGYGVALCMLR